MKSTEPKAPAAAPVRIGYFLSTLARPDLSSDAIAAMVASGNYEEFIECFIRGLAHQIRCQTGSMQPIGHVMGNRIRGDLRELIAQLSEQGAVRPQPAAASLADCASREAVLNYMQDYLLQLHQKNLIPTGAADSLLGAVAKLRTVKDAAQPEPTLGRDVQTLSAYLAGDDSFIDQARQAVIRLCATETKASAAHALKAAITGLLANNPGKRDGDPIRNAAIDYARACLETPVPVSLPVTKVIIVVERSRGKEIALVVEDNGTEDGGRSIARFYDYGEMLRMAPHLNWHITHDEFATR